MSLHKADSSEGPKEPLMAHLGLTSMSCGVFKTQPYNKFVHELVHLGPTRPDGADGPYGP
jgi:hypothetical protein